MGQLSDMGRIKRYSIGKSPYVGLPVVEDGSRRPAVFLRNHLQAAVAAGVLHASYIEAYHDAEGQHYPAVLVMNGGKAKYTLIDLSTSTPNHSAMYVREVHTKWAKGRRKSAITRTATPAQREALKIQAEVAKLERAKAKIYCERPRNPLIREPRDEYNGNYYREAELKWKHSKPVRKALARLTGPYLKRRTMQARPPWKKFYADCARVLGLDSIDAGRKHDRVCNRKNGPDMEDYLKQLPVHLEYRPAVS